MKKLKKIYIVTGAFGHLGINIVKMLLEKCEKVIAFDLNIRKKYFKDNNLTIVKGNICIKDDVRKLFNNLDNYDVIVIHCAGIVSIASKYDKRVYDVNVSGTKNIVDICLDKNVYKLIYVSSVHAIPEGKKGSIISEIKNFDENNVIGLYAKTKAIATNYVIKGTKKGLNASIVHPSGIIGPYDYNIGHTTRLIMDYVNHHLTAAINGGYDFVDVRDVSEAIIKCVSKGKRGQCYILSNRYITVKELLDELHEITGVKKIKTFLPMWFIRPMAVFAELYYKIRKTKPLFTSYSLYTLNSNSNFSFEKAKKELDFNPRDLSETLKDTCTWLKEINK